MTRVYVVATQGFPPTPTLFATEAERRERTWCFADRAMGWGCRKVVQLDEAFETPERAWRVFELETAARIVETRRVLVTLEDAHACALTALHALAAAPPVGPSDAPGQPDGRGDPSPPAGADFPGR